jgi:hypothetical protein
LETTRFIVTSSKPEKPERRLVIVGRYHYAIFLEFGNVLEENLKRGRAWKGNVDMVLVEFY